MPPFLTRSLSFRIVAILLACPLGIVLACADEAPAFDDVIVIYPVTNGGAHGPEDRPISRVIVVSAQTSASAVSAVAAAKDVLARGGMTVLDPDPPFKPAEAHGPVSPSPSKANGALLALGEHAGADHVLVVEVTDALVPERQGNKYLHDERVSVRGLSVSTGAVVLEGSARWSHPVEQAGQEIRALTAYAIARAVCDPDKWVEASAANNGRGRCGR